MTDTALNLVEQLLPRVQVRQWVCSLPFRLRALCGYHSRLCAGVVSAFAQELSRSLRHRVFVPPADEAGFSRLEAALDCAVAALAVEARIRDAVRAGHLDRAPGDTPAELALRGGVITETDRETLRAADEIHAEVIQVDAFDREEYRSIPR